MKQLFQLNDRELSELFAVEVAGWKCVSVHQEHQFVRPWVNASGGSEIDPVFAMSADKVLPWLEKSKTNARIQFGYWGDAEWQIYMFINGEQVVVLGSTFARAVCKALLEARGITEVEP
jgi:hypothetical protein